MTLSVSGTAAQSFVPAGSGGIGKATEKHSPFRELAKQLQRL